MQRVGIRELRQHASHYVGRATAGESFEVTDRGRPVALLSPLAADSWDTLVATGKVKPGTSGSDLLDIESVDGDNLTERLLAQRDAER
jgi:prevent-host-death family protein